MNITLGYIAHRQSGESSEHQPPQAVIGVCCFLRADPPLGSVASSMVRHPDFEKIHSAFLAHYSKDPQLGEARYADWVKFSDLDESQSYYAQGVARAVKSKQSFGWANFLLQFVKEDRDARYYKVEALFPVESMNSGPPFTRDEVFQSARSLTGKPSDLNHDPKQELKGVEVVAAQFEDDCVECLVRVPKVSPLIGMIERKEIVNVSIEGEWSHGIPGQGLVLTGLGWLTKNTLLPGIPLTRITPVEHIVESFVVQRLQENLVVSLQAIPLREAAGDLPSDFTAFKVRFQVNSDNPCPRCEALDGKEFIYGTEPELPLHDNCECSYEVVERLHVHLPAAGPAGQVAQSGVENLNEEELKALIKSGVAEGLRAREQADADKQAQIVRSQKYGIGIKQGGAVTKPGEYANLSEDQFADPVNFSYPVDAAHCKAALGYFNQPDNRSQYSQEEQNKIMQKIVAACVANGVEVSWQPNDAAYKALPGELAAKCTGYTKESTDAEKLAVAESKLVVANKTIEDLRKQLPGGGLLKDPPKMMPVREAVAILEAALPAPMVERSAGLGMQRMCQGIRSEILKLKDKAGAK